MTMTKWLYLYTYFLVIVIASSFKMIVPKTFNRRLPELRMSGNLRDDLRNVAIIGTLLTRFYVLCKSKFTVNTFYSTC